MSLCDESEDATHRLARALGACRVVRSACQSNEQPHNEFMHSHFVRIAYEDIAL